MELRKHAYLTARGFEFRECGKWKVEDFDASQFNNADALFARLYSANRAVWILSEDLAQELRRPLETPSARFEVKRSEKTEAHLEMTERISFKPRGAEDRDGAQLFFPEKSEAWGIDEGDDVEVIERATVRLQDHFKRSLVYPPGRLNVYLMEGARDRANEQVNYKRAPTSFEMFKPPVIEYLDWCKVRRFTEAEKQARYIHSFDKNAMYLNAVGVPLGVGTYRHAVNPDVVNQPGVWRVKSSPLADCNLFNVPGAQNEWVCTPTLLLLQELGLLREVSEAYICDESHKLFPTYYAHMKKALALCDASPVGETMKGFVKVMYTRGVGYLNSDLFEGEWFHRPDWWSMIVSEAGARVFRDAVQVNNECGVTPIATHIDCLYYVSNEPDAYAALPIFSASLANKFKHKGTCEITPEMIQAFDDGKGSGEFAGMVKRGIKARRGEQS